MIYFVFMKRFLNHHSQTTCFYLYGHLTEPDCITATTEFDFFKEEFLTCISLNVRIMIVKRKISY